VGSEAQRVKGVIQSVEVTYFVHATEDQGKIGEAVARLLGQEPDGETEVLEGHFGNQILRARVHLTGEDAGSAFNRLVDSFPAGVLQQVLTELESHLDEHSAFFVRLDKQSLVSGTVSLGTSDPIRVKVKPRAFLIRGGAVSFYSRLLRRR
jgi:RNA binding exosome subunit